MVQDMRSIQASVSSSQCPPIDEEESPKELQKKLEEIDKYVNEDSLKIKENDQLSAGTIIKSNAKTDQLQGVVALRNIALVEIIETLKSAIGTPGIISKKHLPKMKKEGYELVGIILDKMMKHGTIFSSTHPKPSEAEHHGLTTGETDRIMFKLDTKLVLIYNNNEYEYITYGDGYILKHQ
ncbi:hypothetical protein BDF21DRAFT_455044 [Thamnidium elegans]|nr:hypothetical protein BDF21DRAFT_455044 [Thamnidium elegans]